MLIKLVRRRPAFLTKTAAFSSTMSKEMEVVTKLKGICDPCTNRTIQNLGMIQSIRVGDDSAITIRMDFITPGYPHQHQIEQQITDRLSTLQWVANVDFKYEQPKKYAGLNSISIQDTAISKIGHIIGVSSCKGGVGKSTVAANLAITLTNMGLRVGILDADIYGPSLPVLIPELSSEVVRSPTNPKHVLPLRSRHQPELRMLSFGHVNPKSGAPGAGGKEAAVVRGPIASRIINQLLLSTEWDDLDYLVIDMPPGTGDVQITLSQSACLSGAVVVTTSHRLSLVDAAKGVAMFEELKVPTLAVVENMAHFTCEHGTRYFPFGKGGRENLLKGCRALLSHTSHTSPSAAGNKDIGEGGTCDTPATPHHHPPGESCGGSHGSGKYPPHTLPATSITNKTTAVEVNASYLRLQHCPLHSLPIAQYDILAGDENALLPETLRNPNSPISAVYKVLAKDVLEEVFKTQISAQLVPSIRVAADGAEVVLRYYGPSRTREYSIPSVELRIRDPMTGKVSIPDGVSREVFIEKLKNIRPEKFDHKGQYGVAIVWSDGHFADIFPYDILRSIAEEVLGNRK